MLGVHLPVARETSSLDFRGSYGPDRGAVKPVSGPWKGRRIRRADEYLLGSVNTYNAQAQSGQTILQERTLPVGDYILTYELAEKSAESTGGGVATSGLRFIAPESVCSP